MIPLSASRIKTFQDCSWKYYCHYLLKLPEKGNEGSSRGWIAHLVFSVLGDPRRKAYYDEILEKKDVYCIPSISRLIFKHAVFLKINDAENMKSVNDLIIDGLNYDFFGKKLGIPDKSELEIEFDLTVGEGEEQFRVRGFIDQLFLYKKKSLAFIRDFKTSKAVYSDSDVDDNMQDFIYRLAVKHLYPEFLKRRVEFVFLKFLDKDGIIQTKTMTEEQHQGLEIFLAEIQKIINGFNLETAKSNFAKDKGFPSDGSFSGRLQCGFGKKPGQIKRDGTPMWDCPYKWGFKYYGVFDKGGKILRTYFLDEAYLIEYNPEDGEYLQMMKYNGCPKWNRYKLPAKKEQ